MGLAGREGKGRAWLTEEENEGIDLAGGVAHGEDGFDALGDAGAAYGRQARRHARGGTHDEAHDWGSGLSWRTPVTTESNENSNRWSTLGFLFVFIVTSKGRLTNRHPDA